MFYVYLFYVIMCFGCTMWVACTLRDQKRGLDSLQLELQIVVIYHEGAGKGTQVS